MDAVDAALYVHNDLRHVADGGNLHSYGSANLDGIEKNLNLMNRYSFNKNKNARGIASTLKVIKLFLAALLAISSVIDCEKTQ